MVRGQSFHVFLVEDLPVGSWAQNCLRDFEGNQSKLLKLSSILPATA